MLGLFAPKFDTGQTLIYVQKGATTPNNVGPTMLLRPFARNLR